MGEFFESIDFYAELVLDGGLELFVPEIDDFDGDCFGGGLVDSFEDVAPFGQVEVVVEPIRVVFDLFAELVPVFSVHALNIIKNT